MMLLAIKNASINLFLFRSILGSIGEIWRNDGILGFFAGVMPKIFCDIACLTLTSSTVYMANKYLIRDKESRQYFASFTQVCICWLSPRAGRGSIVLYNISKRSLLHRIFFFFLVPFLVYIVSFASGIHLYDCIRKQVSRVKFIWSKTAIY